MRKLLAIALIFWFWNPLLFSQQNAATGRTYLYGPSDSSASGFLISSNGSNTIQFGINGIGDSNFASPAFGLQGGGKGMFDTICQDLGLATTLCNDKANQSDNAADMAFRTFFNFNLSDTGNPLGFYVCCSNESDLATENTTAQYLGMRQSQEATGSYMTLGTTEKSMSLGKATSLTTFATDSSTFTASGGVSTATTGSFNQVVYVGTSGVLYLWQYEYSSGGGSFQVLDKSVVPAGVALTDTITNSTTLTCTSISRAAVNVGTTWAGAARFTGLTPGYHTLTVNVTVSGKVGIIGFGSPLNLKRGSGSPTLIWGNTIREQYNANQSFVVNTNNNEKVALSDLISDGFNITVADLYNATDALLDFDSKAILGYTVTSQGSGQTNGNYTGSVTGSTCGAGTPQFAYIIAGGLLTSIQPTVTIGSTTTYASNCTVAGTATIAAGGTPATVTPILSTNTNYNAQAPFHLSLAGAQHTAHTLEGAAQAVGIAYANGCAGTGSQTVNINTRCIVHFGAATDTFPNTVGSMAPGQCVTIQQTSSGSASYVTIAGGSGGNASGKVIGPGGAAQVCSFDNAGNIGYGPESEGSNGTGPTIAAGAAAGTSPGTPTITGTQSIKQFNGTVTVITGTATTATGTLATVTWNGTLPTAYTQCSMFPRNAAAATLATADIFTNNPGTTTEVISVAGTAMGASTTYIWSMQCHI